MKIKEHTEDTEATANGLRPDEIEYLNDPTLPRCDGCGHLLILHEYTGGNAPCVICGCD